MPGGKSSPYPKVWAPVMNWKTQWTNMCSTNQNKYMMWPLFIQINAVFNIMGPTMFLYILVPSLLFTLFTFMKSVYNFLRPFVHLTFFHAQHRGSKFTHLLTLFTLEKLGTWFHGKNNVGAMEGCNFYLSLVSGLMIM